MFSGEFDSGETLRSRIENFSQIFSREDAGRWFEFIISRTLSPTRKQGRTISPAE